LPSFNASQIDITSIDPMSLSYSRSSSQDPSVLAIKGIDLQKKIVRLLQPWIDLRDRRLESIDLIGATKYGSAPSSITTSLK
jgi:hypothetical protein